MGSGVEQDLTAYIDAVDAVQNARVALDDAEQRELAMLIAARCEGIPYDDLARARLRRVLGRPPTTRERRLESSRLRKAIYRVTARNANVATACRDRRDEHEGSTLRSKHAMSDPKLIRREVTTTTIEEYLDGDLQQISPSPKRHDLSDPASTPTVPTTTGNSPPAPSEQAGGE